MLLVHGADIKARTKDGENALHLAASSLHTLEYKNHNDGLKAMQFLIDRGADVNARTIKSPDNAEISVCRTPLHEAAWHGKSGMVKLLIDNGADVHAQDSNGNTPLDLVDLAIQKYEEDSAKYMKIETLLRDHGAKVNLTLSAENGNCTSAVDKQLVTKVPLVNNTVTSGLPLSLPSAPRSAISRNSMDFSQSVPEGSSFMALAMLAFSFLGVGMVVTMRARTKPRTGQPNVEMGLLDEQLNRNEQILKKGNEKFGAYPESSLSETTSAGLDHQISF